MRPLNFAHATVIRDPFPHIFAPDLIDGDSAGELLRWFETGATWVEKNVEEFYESYDLSLRAGTLPPELAFWIDDDFLLQAKHNVSRLLGVPLGATIDVTAHRLDPGQHIAVHTDYGSVGQTCRLLIQVNRGWTLQQGGILMFFADDTAGVPDDRDRYYLPHCRSSVCFEVSPRSFHAVSTVKTGERFTLCLSFY